MKISLLNKLLISIFFFIAISVFFIKIVNPVYALTPRNECVKDHGPVNCAFSLVATGAPGQQDEGYCIEGCAGEWSESCPQGATCESKDAACKCQNGGVTCYRPLPTPIPTIPKALYCAGLSSPAERTPPNLGDTISLTCNKNADFVGAVTYNFRLINKVSPQDSIPIPVPTAFVQNSTNNTTSYTFSRGRFGYYLFQCQICSGGFCTDWQAGPL